MPPNKTLMDDDKNPSEGVKSDWSSAFDAGVRAALAATAGPALEPLDEESGERHVILTGDQHVETVEHTLALPRRKKGVVHLKDAESFAQFVKEQRTDDSRVYANPDGASFTCVLNHHGAKADWCDYLAKLVLQASPAWTTWVMGNKKSMGQAAFAEFLEDNLPEVVEPDGAVLLQAATYLEAKKSVHFKSGITLATGAYKLTYEEDVEQRSKGDLVIPSRLVLGLAPFHRGPVYRVGARLRYRIADDRLTFAYLLDHPDRIVEEAFAVAVDQIGEQTGMDVLLGEPPRGL